MSSESTIFNNDEILLPPKNNKKKTLVLDLDETLVHSQFMSFSDPSDVVIQIELENEMHDIHVMVRPGVKEFLEKMSKIYEIVIFTASVSKYADPLLNIIDKKGYCPYRLFREHCSLINTTFVKDLQRLGRDIKNIIIVDNSPISYALHPENGLPILAWFEDKSDRELYKITTILQFLSTVYDVREFIPKFVDNNTINYEKANEIIKNYNGQKHIFRENRYSNNSNKTSYDGKGINIKIDNSNNSKSNILQNKDKKTYNKNNNCNHKDKLVELAMKNIITSVSPMTVIPINSINNNSLLRSQRNSKNKIIANNQKKGTVNEEQKNNKEKNYIKIDPKNRIMNIKNLSITNSTQSTKKM
jgi:RNA polymerase II subunit A small phosphatase-like protein